MAASYFDVDGTLLATNLVHPTLYYLVNQPSPLQSLQRLHWSPVQPLVPMPCCSWLALSSSHSDLC